MNNTPTSRRPLRTSAAAAMGLECRGCGGRAFETIRTERRDGFIIRRRECLHCKARYTTREVVISKS